MSMWLSDKEVVRLTRKVRPTAQARVLAESGIKYKMVNKRPMVPREQFQDDKHTPTGGLVLDASLA